MQRLPNDVTYASTGGAFFGWLFAQDWLLIISAVSSILVAVFTIYFKYKEDKRQQIEFEHRLKHEADEYNSHRHSEDRHERH